MAVNREGQRVPQVTFKLRKDHEWVHVSSDQIFSGRTVAVFSLPGAFTPTCSSAHVPRYNELAPLFKRNGVDAIVCISVNDAFVMNEWQRDQNADYVQFIPDGSGEFTRGMGMLVNKDDLGFGERSWRYSMLVKDGVIEKMFVEPNKPGDPYEVSDADTMLDFINPNAGRPLDVTLFTREGCPFCRRAKGLLHDRDIGFDEILLDGEVTRRSLRAVAGAETVPQVFINGRHIGGTEALERWLDERKAA
ncbi:MAG: glutathione peroxidase [Gammaproteobacteria bacterium]|nr:glutathione peroxidase [Gammaproteobacteria bacterium]